MRQIAAAVLGALLATAVCWGALYLYGTFVLTHGSLFDTNPSAAELFFAVWGVGTLISAVVAVALTQRKK